MSRVKNGSNYTVYGFMRDDLGLKGERLTVYAVIHNFYMWQGAFIGNFELIADWLGCDESHAVEVLKSLCEDGLVNVQEIGERLAFLPTKTRNDY